VQRFETLDRFDGPEGRLELRRRGARDFLITVDGRVLMTSTGHRSEDALATSACAALGGRPRPRVLIGGLGMGYTLRAALDALPREATVVVAEISPQVVTWCRGPLAILTDSAVNDRRVKVEIADVAETIAEARGLDAIILDLYEGPHAATQRAADPHYGDEALERVDRALAPGGVLAIWSEEPDRVFETRLRAHGFALRKERPRGGRKHVVYLASRARAAPKRARRFRD
jgi:spermidine synthase